MRCRTTIRRPGRVPRARAKKSAGRAMRSRLARRRSADRPSRSASVLCEAKSGSRIPVWGVRSGRGGSQNGLHHAVIVHDAHEGRSEEHTSELQSLMRISYAVFCLKNKKQKTQIYE